MSNHNSESSIKVDAKSIEQAIVKAAGALGVNQDEVAYEVIKEDTSKGFLSFFKSSSVEIKAWIKTRNERNQSRRGGRRDEGPSRRSETRTHGRQERSSENYTQHGASNGDEELVQAEPLAPEKIEALMEELKEFCAGICSKISGEKVTVTASADEGRLILDIDSDYMAQQITKNTKLAEAMEHILRKKPRHLRQELPFRIFVDVSGIRRKREDDLIHMAYDLSAKVYENKRPIVLNYKSSYDRKIIHMALDKDDRVYTKSIGSGPNRKLMILPTKDMSSADAIEQQI
jgi:spoIIIJ-associated protein